MADRGIGGTGIVGVITGFASICINNIRVDYHWSTPILVEGIPAAADQLRAGQVVAIEADHQVSPHAPPQARKVSIIYQVSGPIDVITEAQVLRVAGQPVIVRRGVMPQGKPLRAGDWVIVSGLRTLAGEIAATRVDRRLPGRVSVRGRLSSSGGEFRIGELPVRLPLGTSVVPGWFVAAEGGYDGNTMIIDKISRDAFADDPFALFTPQVSRFYIETFARLEGDKLVSNYGWTIIASPGLRGGVTPDMPVVIEVERRKDGLLAATRFLETSPSLGNPAIGFRGGPGNRALPETPLPAIRGGPGNMAPDNWTPATPGALPSFPPASGRGGGGRVR